MRIFASFALLIFCGFASATSLDLSAYRNQVVLVDFWASWCGPCHASFPWLHSLHSKYERQGLKVITVNLDERKEDAEAFLRTHASSLPVIYDPKGDIARSFDLLAMPTSLLIDRQGKLRFRHNGFLQSKTIEYEEHLRTLLLE